MTSTPECQWMSIYHLSLLLRAKGIPNTRENLRSLVCENNIAPWRSVERRRRVEIFADPEAVLSWMADNHERLLLEDTERRAAIGRATLAAAIEARRIRYQPRSLEELPGSIRKDVERKARVLMRYWDLHSFPVPLPERLAELGYHGPLPLLYVLRKTKVRDTDKYNHASSWK